MAGITMYDSADDAAFPRGAQAYAAYLDGQVESQPNWSWVCAEFPAAHHLSISLSPGLDADALDVENGAATVADVPGWWKRQRDNGAARPCVYASAAAMQSGIVPLITSGAIPRASVRAWTAHYAGEHICGPSTCGELGIDADGTQWTDTAYGRNLDQSLLAADFFGTPQAAVREWVTEGTLSLPALAAQEKTQVSAILRLTCQHAPGSVFPAGVAALVDGVFAGVTDPSRPMPAGLKLYLPF